MRIRRHIPTLLVAMLAAALTAALPAVAQQPGGMAFWRTTGNSGTSPTTNPDRSLRGSPRLGAWVSNGV